MKIKKVEWKNFASYGNRKQILEFPDEPSLFQVIGENGSGKSSISQVITFAFYGKVEGKKLGDIPNRINGNAWVRVEFESDGKNIAVERGLEPSLFDLYIDGMKYDQAGQRTVQDYLSEDILGIPYYVFNNTILLSINDFKSFIKMSVQDKRAIVDKIFGFHILNQMRDALKEESKKIKESMDNLSGQMTSIGSLSPNNPANLALNKLPLPRGVTFHSIIGDRGKGDTPNSSDGIVPYWSSHVTPIASEKIVSSNHGVPDNADAAVELKRILKLHLGIK
jgi:DNA repair exonuclease SbcCD ATPase subunit